MTDVPVRTARRIVEMGCTPDDPEEVRLRKATLTVAAITISVLAFVWVATYWALGLAGAAAIPAFYQVATVIGLIGFARSKAFGPFRLSQLGLMIVLPFALQWTIGGFVASSAVSLWSLIPALGAVFFYGARGGIPWFAAFIVLTAVSALIDPLVAQRAASIPIELRTAFFGLNVGGVAITTFAIVQYFVRQREAALSALDAEHRRSESLLLSILPAPIAARLKHGPEVIAEAHPAVTVLFADVVDFTPYAERTSPGDVVALLDRLFSAFDRLAERHGLEKIKTIGDAYMAVAGLPEDRPDHVEAVLEMAIDMLAQAERCTAEGLPVRLRIGIDSGPVIAGVIGRRKFAYDLWGDTVNTASRMESSGVADRIQVTPGVEAALRDRYAFEQRDPIDVKGKGVMRPYLLVGRRAG